MKHGDKATSVTSSVWDTCPSVKGSSSAVAGAARMLQPRHTEISHGGWVLISSTDTVKTPGSLCSVELEGGIRPPSLMEDKVARGRGRRWMTDLARARRLGGKDKEGGGLVVEPQVPAEEQGCFHRVVGSDRRWLSGAGWSRAVLRDARGPGLAAALTAAGQEAGSARCSTG